MTFFAIICTGFHEDCGFHPIRYLSKIVKVGWLISALVFQKCLSINLWTSLIYSSDIIIENHIYIYYNNPLNPWPKICHKVILIYAVYYELVWFSDQNKISITIATQKS